MPQIAGIANGAMVLQDTAIADMTLETMTKVLRPKIEGTTYLDELFQEDTLDFFIAFSSISCVFGQHGQSNYAAANTFLNGLINRRRLQGLAGSAMAIGAVLGIGYVAREVDLTTYERMKQNGYRLMSERDLHLLFAEAVAASRELGGSSEAFEIITGIHTDKVREERNTKNPVFQHVVTKQRSRLGDSQESSVKIPLKSQLSAATTETEVYEAIRDAFLDKLQTILQLSNSPKLQDSGDELGVDSLIAVEIRSWFLKELTVDLPVLKVLSGLPVGGMIDFAVEKLSSDMTPNLQPIVHATEAIPSSADFSSNHSSTLSIASEEYSDDVMDSVATPNTEVAYSVIGSDAKRKGPMSHAQTRFWFLNSMLENPTAFNITVSFELNGNLNQDKLITAVKVAAERHAALRTRFFDSDDGLPMQEVLDRPTFDLKVRDITDTREVADEYNRLKAHEYNLRNGELMQMTLLTHTASSHFLLVGYHHINMDAVSLKVLLLDIDNVYHGITLNHAVLQYSDFTNRQRQAIENGELKDDLSYWRSEYPNFPPILPLLPFSDATSRQRQTTYSFSKASIKLPQIIGAQIKKVCMKYRISPYHFHLAAFETLLARFLEVDDIAIGMADANRPELDQANAVGLYLNLLPLRLKYEAGQVFAEAAKQVQSKVRQALAHSRIPFDLLIDELKPARSMEYNPIFQAFIDYKPPIPEKTTVFDCKVGSETYDIGQTGYDITLSITDEPDGDAKIMFQLQESLYSTSDAEVLLKSYVILLEQFGSNPDESLEKASLLASEDVERTSRVGTGQ